MSVKFNPLADRVLIEAAPAEQKTASGIFIPDTAKEKPLNGTVIAVGSGKKDEPLTVKVGDTVRIIDGAFTDYTGKITEIDNNKVKMIISMFGNDTIAEVNLSQIAEL